MVKKDGSVAYPMLFGRPWLRRVPLSHIAKTLESKSEEWTSSSYTSINDVVLKMRRMLISQ